MAVYVIAEAGVNHNGSVKNAFKMIDCAKLLEKEGCKYIVIPCNTASYFFDEIQKEVSAKVINILEETSKVVLKDNPKRIGLMATDGTIKSGAYNKFIDNDLLFVPDSEYQAKIMNIIYQPRIAESFENSSPLARSN